MATLKTQTNPEMSRQQIRVTGILCAAAALIPLFYFRITIESYIALKEILISLTALALAVHAFSSLESQNNPPVTICFQDLALTVLILFSLATIRISPNTHEGFLAWMQLPALAILYFAASRLPRRGAWALIAAIAASATGIAIFTISASLYFWLSLSHTQVDLLTRLKSILEFPLGGNNFTAAFLALSLPFTLALRLSENKRTVLLSSLALCIQTTALVVCLSRTAMVATALLFAAGLLVCWRKRLLLLFVRPLLYAVLGASLAVGAFVLLSGNMNSREVVRDLMISPGDGTRQGIDSMHMRLFWWKDTVRMIREHPAGVGYGGFTYVFPRYRTIPEAFIMPETRLTTPHNDYLHVAAETGYAGLALLFVVFAWGFRGALLGLKHDFRDPAALGAAGALLVTAAYSLVDFPLQMPACRFLFFMALGLSASFTIKHARTRTVSFSSWPAAARGGLAVLIAALLWMNWGWQKSFRAQAHVLQQIRLQNDPLASLERFDAAVALDPKAKYAYPFAGSAYVKIDRWSVAVTMFQRAIELDPNDYNAINYLGVALAQGGKFNEAIRQFRKAAEIYPAFSNPHVNMGILYLQRGMDERAAEAFRDALARNNSLIQVYAELASLEIREGNHRAAARLLSKALDIEPDNQMIKSELMQLHKQLSPEAGPAAHPMQKTPQPKGGTPLDSQLQENPQNPHKSGAIQGR